MEYSQMQVFIEVYTKLAYCMPIILNLLCKQLVSDTFFTWKNYILRQGFKGSSVCGTCT
jgi:hypothetical protein